MWLLLVVVGHFSVTTARSTDGRYRDDVIWPFDLSETPLLPDHVEGPSTQPTLPSTSTTSSPFSTPSSTYLPTAATTTREPHGDIHGDAFFQDIDNELEREESQVREEERKEWLRRVEEGRRDEATTAASTPRQRRVRRLPEGGEEEYDDYLDGHRLVYSLEGATTARPSPSTASSPRPTWAAVTAPQITFMTGRMKVYYDGSTDDVTVIKMHRTPDNADLFTAHRIETGMKYRVEIEVEKEDQGELICHLRTDKAFAVNRIPTPDDDEFDHLLKDM